MFTLPQVEFREVKNLFTIVTDEVPQHAVGGTLLAILIGPYAASIAVTVALILQAFLFGDGGILAL